MKYLEKPYTKEAAAAFLHRCGMAEEPLVYAVEDCSRALIGYIIYHPYDAASMRSLGPPQKPVGQGLCQRADGSSDKDAQSRTDHLIIECLPSQTATKRIAQKYHFSFVENRDGLDVYMLRLNRKF